MQHKAILMAGGCGTRGRPYTDFIPKALLPVRNRPVIAHIAEHLSLSPLIGEIIVLADYEGMGRQIRNYFGEGKIRGKPVRFVQDSQSGTGGDLLHLRRHLENSGDFILWFADNICALDVKDMLHTLDDTKTLACVAVRAARREETGFARTEGKIVREFVEKPMLTLPMKECIGTYALSQKIFELIKNAKRKKPKVDLSYDILANMASNGDVSAHDIGNLAWMDAESPAILERKGKIVDRALLQMSSYAKLHGR